MRLLKQLFGGILAIVVLGSLFAASTARAASLETVNGGPALPGQTAPQPPPPGTFVPSPVYGNLGAALVVYSGGTVDGLQIAAGNAGASGVWVQDATGRYQLLPVQAPAFLKSGFASAFPAASPSAPNFPQPIAVTLVVLRNDPTTTGIQGTVTLGPITPVCQVNKPCDSPYQATLNIQNASAAVIAQIRSGADGRYSVTLAPGRYTVVPLSPSGQSLPRASSVQVDVVSGQFATVDIQYDTGIR